MRTGESVAVASQMRMKFEGGLPATWSCATTWAESFNCTDSPKRRPVFVKPGLMLRAPALVVASQK